ncbi:MAG TPA: hypothetical protein VFZ98_05395, partial [Vicinamibacterales bacterium]
MFLLIPALILAVGQQTIPPPARPPGPTAPTQPVRDPARGPSTDPTGTASIRGRVVTSDTGTAVRRATVNLMMAPQPVTVQSGTATVGTQTQTLTRTMTVNGVTTQVAAPM